MHYHENGIFFIYKEWGRSMKSTFDAQVICKKQFMTGNHLYFILTVIAQILAAILSTLLAFIIKFIVEAMEYQDIKRVKFAMILIGILVVGYILTAIIQKVFKNKYIKKGLSQFKMYVFRKILNKSIGEFTSDSSGKIINTFSNDLSSIELNYLNGNIQIVQQVMMFIFSLAAMLYINWIIMLCVVAACAVPIAISLKYGNRLQSKEKKTSDENEGFVDQVKDLLNGFFVIKSFKAEKEAIELFEKQNFSLEEAKRDRRETNDSMTIASDLANILVIFVIFSVGAYLVFKDIMSVGDVLAFVQLSNYILMPITKLIPMWSNRRAAIVLIDKIAEVIKYEESTEKKVEIRTLKSSIALKDISFAYEEEKNILKHITVSFDKGKSYAIVGGSGCGKSTLLQLILGYFNNYSGKVMIDDTELREINLDSFYDVVSIIQQNVFLFDSSIKNNITMFKEFPEDKLIYAEQLAGLSDLIAEKGEDYACGEGGRNLSGGEKQRISIARSLIRETQVLLMDEATAALDNTTAHEVTNAILDIKDITRIIVTHKLEENLMRKYDEIIVLRDGAIVERGTFEQLMEAKKYFYSLYYVEGE